MGPGKYDDIATRVRLDAQAKGVAILVFGGNRGSGFSVQADLQRTLAMPRMLRIMADEIERSHRSAMS